MTDIVHEIVEEDNYLPAKISVGTCNHTTFPIHWHEYVEVIYLQCRRMTAVVDADTYELLPGDLLIINSGALHMTKTYDCGTRYLLLQVSAKRLQEFFPDFDLIRFSAKIDREKVEQCPFLIKTIADMMYLNEQKEDGYPLLFTARLYEFFYTLYKNHSYRIISRTDTASNRDLNRITDIVDWTREHFREPLSLDDAAYHLGISKEYFCRIFKKYTGQTFLEYLGDIRAMNLYDEMQTSDQSITELMEHSGITNYKTFIRTFKRIYGNTPQKLRKTRIA